MDIETLLGLAASGAGGAVIGPIISKLLGGKGSTGILAGVIGGIAGNYGLDQMGVQILSNGGLVRYVSHFVEGGVGGGILGGLLGVLTRSRK